MIYTSGSTGQPKGVQLSQAGLVNLAAGHRPGPRGCPRRRILQVAAFSFDAAVLDVAVTLAGGATLVVASADERTEARLTALLRAGAVASASVSPSLLTMLEPGAVPGAGTLLVGSERVSALVAQAWGPGRRLVNAYGPTETTVDRRHGGRATRRPAPRRRSAARSPTPASTCWTPTLRPVPGRGGGGAVHRRALGRPAATAAALR